MVLLMASGVYFRKFWKNQEKRFYPLFPVYVVQDTILYLTIKLYFTYLFIYFFIDRSVREIRHGKHCKEHCQK